MKEIGGVIITPEMVARFYAKVEVIEGDECWWWTGVKDRKGYGQFWAPLTKCGMCKAHRFAYWIIRGPLFEEEEIDHLCHNPECVNPYHMEVLDKTTNTARGNVARWRKERDASVSFEELLPVLPETDDVL